MNNEQARELLTKYKEGRCTADELAQLESWYLEGLDEPAAADFSIEEVQQAKADVWATLPVHETVRAQRRSWLGLPVYYSRIAAAAVITLCVSYSLYFFSKSSRKEEVTASNTIEIKPGSHKATLTLADGKSIALTDAQNGKLLEQGGTQVVKNGEGELVYTAGNQKKAVEYHLLTIPRGGYYTLTLSDGTKVWLNAESSLRYPNEFVGNERVVELTGEGYFEVAKNAGQTFKVRTNKQTVEVLGTHFNINAYGDDGKTVTSLLEGSVQIQTVQGISKVLKPGQRADVTDELFRVYPAKVWDAIDWTTNKFEFNNESLTSILNKISRWYDVEISCPADLGKLTFKGSMPRSKTINEVLNIMELTKLVDFKIEGRRITVTK